VREVAPGSSAEEAGLAAGDVILQIGSREVDSASEAARLLDESGDSVRMLVQSQDSATRWLVLENRASD
jgi:C-terminal processing protease CtpA/Prc